MVNEYYTTRQVADAMQVSESSVKRWCDSGVIPMSRTAGGHRRIPLTGLMRFLESTNRRLMDTSALGLSFGGDRRLEGDPGQHLDESQAEQLQHDFESAMIRGDEVAARHALTQWYAMERSMASMADRLIAATFHRLGDQWSCEEIEIYQERRACEICTRLIHELRRLVPDPIGTSPIAIGCSTACDYYTLPGQLVELVLRENGWRASNLGCNLPFDSILQAIRDQKPKLFWLSVSFIPDESKFVESFQDFVHQVPREVTVVVGGRSLHDGLRPKLSFTAHCDTMQQLASFSQAVRGFRPNGLPSPN